MIGKSTLFCISRFLSTIGGFRICHWWYFMASYTGQLYLSKKDSDITKESTICLQKVSHIHCHPKKQCCLMPNSPPRSSEEGKTKACIVIKYWWIFYFFNNMFLLPPLFYKKSDFCIMWFSSEMYFTAKTISQVVASLWRYILEIYFHHLNKQWWVKKKNYEKEPCYS